MVDYLGIADQLKQALADYTERDRDATGIPIEEAVALLKEKHEIVTAMFHGFDWRGYAAGDGNTQLRLLTEGANLVSERPELKERFVAAVTALSRAFALAVPHEEALALRDDVAYFQAVRSVVVKYTVTGGRPEEDLDAAVRQLVSRAVASDRVVDIFAAAGLQKPDISILSDEFLAEVQGMPQKNLALEMLRKLLNDEIRAQSRRNLVQARSFAEMLERTIRAYQNRSIEAAQVIAELVEMARHMREARGRGEALGLTDDELAFYDALGANDSAVMELSDETLKAIARDLVTMMRQSVTIDWTVKESVRAAMRAAVKRLLRRYGYPPDKREQATDTVLEQAQQVCRNWAEEGVLAAPPTAPSTPAGVGPFRVLALAEARPYENLHPPVQPGGGRRRPGRSARARRWSPRRGWSPTGAPGPAPASSSPGWWASP